MPSVLLPGPPGYVEESRNDMRRLAKFLGLTVRAFQARHIVRRTRKGSKRIKSGFGTCQFLAGRTAAAPVYEARPRDLPRLCLLEPGRHHGV